MKKQTFINYLYTISYQILMVITPLVTAPYISHVLHADGVGIYSYTGTIANAFSLFAALGINIYGQRQIAYYQDDPIERSRVFWELFCIRIATTLLVSIVYVVVSLRYIQYTLYLMLQSIAVFSVALDISWFYQGIEDFKTISVRNIAVKLATVALVFCVVKNETDLWKYILLCSLSSLVGYVFFFFKLNTKIIKVPVRELNFRRHYRFIIEFFIPIIATQIYSQLDKIMLGMMTIGDAENGYYEQARKIVNIVITLVTALNTVLYPRISNLYINGEKTQISKTYSQAFRIIMMLVIPMSIGLWFVADNFALWFFGLDFAKVGILLKISSLLLVAMAVGNFVGVQYLLPTGKQNIMTRIYIISAIINLGLNYLFIKRYLSVGALIASVAAEFFSAGAQMWLMQQGEYRFNLMDGLWKYLTSGAIMGLGIFFFQRVTALSGVLETVVEVALGIILYGISLLILKEELVFLFIGKHTHS